MPFYTELDVINACLASLGEAPLNEADDDHPLVAPARTALKTANMREQAKSWWFNRELVTLTPDPSSGFIYTPDDAIRVDPTNTTLNYVQRGRRLYNSYAPNSTTPYVFTSPVTCWLVRLVLFEDIPPSAQVVISLAAQVSFQKDYDADATKYKQVLAEYTEALLSLSAENIRNQNINMIRKSSTLRTLNQIGVYANPGGLPVY
jgi:hypothetical protein